VLQRTQKACLGPLVAVTARMSCQEGRNGWDSNECGCRHPIRNGR
jgi:hypothetical protein